MTSNRSNPFGPPNSGGAHNILDNVPLPGLTLVQTTFIRSAPLDEGSRDYAISYLTNANQAGRTVDLVDYNSVAPNSAESASYNSNGHEALVIGGPANTTYDLNAGGLFIGTGGSDNIVVSGNDDTVTVLSAGANIEVNGSGNTLTTGNGDNNISVNGADNTIISGTGNDSIEVMGNGNQINAGEGNDNVHVTGTGNIINAGDGNDQVSVDGHLNVINGEDGDDYLRVDSGSTNVVVGGEGNDSLVLNGNGQNNRLAGGEGNDEIWLNAQGGQSAFSPLANIGEGGDGNDLLVSTATNNALIGGAGNDGFVSTASGSIIIAGSISNNGIVPSTSAEDIRAVDGTIFVNGEPMSAAVLTPEIVDVSAAVRAVTPEELRHLSSDPDQIETPPDSAPEEPPAFEESPTYEEPPASEEPPAYEESEDDPYEDSGG